MKCPESISSIQALLDGERVDRAELAGHLHACSACRDLHASAVRMRNHLLQQTAPAVPEGFAQRVQSRWSRQRTVQRWTRGVLAAAAILLCLGVAVWASKQWKPTADQPHVVQPIATKPELKTPVRVTVNHAGQGLFSFGSQFTSSLTKPAKPLFNRLDEAKLPLPSGGLPADIGKAFTTGIEPLADYLGGLFGVFFKLFPEE